MRLGLGQGKEEKVVCSFCGQDQKSVKTLISGPSDVRRVYICNECVAICNEIIGGDDSQQEELSDKELGS